MSHAAERWQRSDHGTRMLARQEALHQVFIRLTTPGLLEKEGG